jgi:hypothetical protein
MFIVRCLSSTRNTPAKAPSNGTTAELKMLFDRGRWSRRMIGFRLERHSGVEGPGGRSSQGMPGRSSLEDMVSGFLLFVLLFEIAAQGEYIRSHRDLHVFGFETRQVNLHHHFVGVLVQVDRGDYGDSTRASRTGEGIIEEPVHRLPQGHHFAHGLPTSKIGHSEPPFE